MEEELGRIYLHGVEFTKADILHSTVTLLYSMDQSKAFLTDIYL